jgi:hypothetical protein
MRKQHIFYEVGTELNIIYVNFMLQQKEEYGDVTMICNHIGN